MSVDTLERRRVRVLFGSHTVADQTLEFAAAREFESGMHRRFPSLRVTNEPVGLAKEPPTT